MRFGFRHIALGALRKRRVGWLARQGGKYLPLAATAKLGLRPVVGPLMAPLILTYRCNERCHMCALPERAKADARMELDTAEWKLVINDLARSGVSGINFSGGEPTLRDDLPDLIRHALSHRLPVTVNTNALLLTDPDRAARLVDAGPDAINISIDASTVDPKAVSQKISDDRHTISQSLAALDHARRQSGVHTALNAVYILAPGNTHRVSEVLQACEQLGFDSFGVMPLHRLPGAEADNAAPADETEKDAYVRTIREATDFLRKQKSRSDGKIAIENSDGYLRMLPRAASGEPSSLACVTGYILTAVDPYGDVYPCWPWLERAQSPIGNVRDLPWHEIWQSAAYEQARRDTAMCRDCYWDCQQEGNLLFSLPFLRNA